MAGVWNNERSSSSGASSTSTFEDCRSRLSVRVIDGLRTNAEGEVSSWTYNDLEGRARAAVLEGWSGVLGETGLAIEMSEVAVAAEPGDENGVRVSRSESPPGDTCEPGTWRRAE